MSAENEITDLYCKVDYNRIIYDFEQLTGLIITNDCIDYLLATIPTYIKDPLEYSSMKDKMLLEYDNYMMSNKTKDKLEYELHMEEMANKQYPEFPEDNLNYYCKYKTIYFEWNKMHMSEYPERNNTIGEVAKLIVDNVKSKKVDTRKNYGEVRYILECVKDNGVKVIVTCYRYDKTHIRIITAWEE